MTAKATRPFTVLTAEFQNEINTFSILPTTYDDYRHDVLLFGDEALAVRADANTELAGFADAARSHGWKQVHTVSAIAEPAGPVTRDAYDRIAGVIVAAAHAHAGRLDGVLLGLHGAMVTQDHGDGEGELLRRLRAVLGPDVPIAITLDPHANVSKTMCDLADIIVSYKTYPHVDMRDTARHAAAILQRTMLGEIRPVTLRVARPMLEEANAGRTDAGAMPARLALARDYEQRPGVYAVSINSGFPNADIEEAGPTVLVTAEGDLQAHARFAASLADDIWNRRAEVMEALYSPADAVALCRQLLEGAAAIAAPAGDGQQSGATGQAVRRRVGPATGPIVLADYADNPGGGAYGDATNLLAAMLAGGLTDACFGPMVDPETVRQLAGAKPGERVRVRLGGKIDARVGGPPLALEATVRLLSNGDWTGSGAMMGGLAYSWGPTVVLDVAGIAVLVVSKPMQILDLEQFRAFGIDPVAMRVVGLKSMQHFRAAFAPVASRILLCDSGALCTRDYSALPFRRIARPVYPLDSDIDLAAWKHRHADGVHIPAPDLGRRISACVAPYVGSGSGKAPGLAVAVVQGGAITHVRGYGCANLEQGTPVTPGTAFHTASAGKMFTAAAVLLLAQDGALALDDTVGGHLPQAPAAWQGMTIDHLLNMTGGLGDYQWTFDGKAVAGAEAPVINLWQDYTDEQLLALACAGPLYFEPGADYRYSNIGYDLLGLIVQRTAGMPYQELLARRVFAPLGMQARAAAWDAVVPGRAAGYSIADGTPVNALWTAPSLYRGGAGGLLLSASDAAKWLLELQRPRLLPQALLARMFEPGRMADGRATVNGYSAGWKQSSIRGWRKQRHGGMWDGVRTEVLRIPELDLAVAVFANCDQIDVAQVAALVAGAADSRAAPYVPQADPDAAATRRDAQLLAALGNGDFEALRTACSVEVWRQWRGAPLAQAVGDRRGAYLSAQLALTEERGTQQGRLRRYVFSVGWNQVHWELVRGAAGRIEAMAFEFE